MKTGNRFLDDSGAKYPIICGPMYPCSNPELVAAVSESGGIGIIQPLSLTYVHGYDYREGIRYIRSLTSRPIGMNVLIEKSSRRYQQKMEKWVDIALDEGIRFFVTSLGNPSWVVKKVHGYGGKVYHDVTELKWAEIACSSNIDGLICVNSDAGGHAGNETADVLFEQLKGFSLPLICAGGVGDKNRYAQMLRMGYEGVQMGTRFIASVECHVPTKYKEAIKRAKKEDIVRSLNLTGVEVSVIKTPYIEALGLKPSAPFSWMLKQPHLKSVVRFLYSLRSIKNLKEMIKGKPSQEGFYQAGKSVATIDQVYSVKEIIDDFTQGKV